MVTTSVTMWPARAECDQNGQIVTISAPPVALNSRTVLVRTRIHIFSVFFSWMENQHLFHFWIVVSWALYEARAPCYNKTSLRSLWLRQLVECLELCLLFGKSELERKPVRSVRRGRSVPSSGLPGLIWFGISIQLSRQIPTSIHQIARVLPISVSGAHLLNL